MHHNIQKHTKTMSQSLIKEGGHQRAKKISIERKQKTIISACLEGTGTLQGLKSVSGYKPNPHVHELDPICHSLRHSMA